MKLNFSYPQLGTQKLIDIEDDRKLRHFYDKRMSAEVEGDALGDEFKGYVFKISGGNDKQGFAMKQGVLAAGRVRLLLQKGHSLFRERRTGDRRRRSVRGCIVSSDLAVLNLVLVKKGEGEIEGLTDKTIPRRLGPKRASKIRKLFNLTKDDDVRRYVIRREIPGKGDKKASSKAPRIQRLITPNVLQRKRHRAALKKSFGEKSKKDAADYEGIYTQRMKEFKEAKAAALAKKREQRRSSRLSDE